MRIIGGTHRGRPIAVPAGDMTRPMTDRARESLFNILGDITGLTVLDAYAGSGALGLEALSRGADSSIGVEAAKAAARVIRNNIEALGVVGKYKIYEEGIEFWLRSYPETNFDLVFADPPYGSADIKIYNQLASRLNPNGLLVIKHGKKTPAPGVEGVELIREAAYADNALAFYRKPQ